MADVEQDLVVDNPLNDGESKPELSQAESHASIGDSIGDTASHAMHSLHDNTLDIFHALESNTQKLGCLSTLWEYTFDPYSNFRQGWDVCMLVLVFYSSINGPYDVAFKDYSSMGIAEVMVDLAFYTDIVLNFWTGFDNGYEIITNKKKIANNYLKGWFWIDAVATIEWDLLILQFTNKVDRDYLRLTRILKVARIARASRLVNRLTQSLTIHTGFVEAVKFFMYVFVVAHLLACFFFMWPTLFTCDPSLVSWVDDATSNRTRWEFCQLHYKDDQEFQTFNAPMIQALDGGMYDVDGNYPGNCFKDSERTCSCTCVPGSWRDVKELDKHKRQHGDEDGPMKQYIIALYWALTTMTTIGYGDISPTSHDGIIFTIFAEVIGLAFFALLLTQINRVVDVMGEQDGVANKIKNEITQFMRWNNMNRELINEVVHFLSFRAGSATGHAMEENDPRFSSLSKNLKRKIKIGLFRPVLERVRFFGWSKVDKKEEKTLQKIFDDMDDDRSGFLDMDEIEQLIAHIGLTLTKDELTDALNEMDTKKTGNVDFQEFRQWWYLNKYGTLMPTKCPGKFLDELCWIMESVAVAPGDVVVGELAPSPLGERLLYGDELIIILSGSLKVIDTKGTMDVDDDSVVSTVRASDESAPLGIDEDMEEGDDGHEEIRHVDQSENESMIGMQAVLEQYCFDLAREKTKNWMVKAHMEYSDLLHVDRNTLSKLLNDAWPEGRDLMRRAALAQYGISEIEAMASQEASEPAPDMPDGNLDAKMVFVNDRITKLDSKLDHLIGLVTVAAERLGERNA